MKIFADLIKADVKNLLFERAKDLSKEEIANFSRRFALDLNDQGHFNYLDAEGNVVQLTDEEVQELIEHVIKMVEEYKQENDIENENIEEEEDIGEEEHSFKIAENTVANESKIDAKSKVDPKEKENKLRQIFVLFSMIQSARNQELIRERKEKLRELADLVRREMIKLKDQKLEETHERVLNEFIAKQELSFEDIKKASSKIQTILTPLQVFSRASGGYKQVQMEGEGTNPLKTHVIKEFYVGSPYESRMSNKEISLLKISQKARFHHRNVA